MMAAWNKHAAIITLLAFLAPMACHGGRGGGLINFTILCSGGWVRPLLLKLPLVGPIITIGCSNNGPRQTPLPPVSTEPAPPSGAGLYPDYYSDSCPKAESIVRGVVEKEIANQGRGIGAGLIRLHFHDCFVEGCDASVLLNTTASGNSDTEREGLPNKNSLRGFDVIDKAKAALEAADAADACPGVVSCADILAFAARDAARVLSGGKIEYKIPAGRLDGRESKADNTGTLPGPFSDLNTLVAKFAAQGLNRADLVRLSAGHSIGVARCLFRSTRPGMNASFSNDLDRQCTNTSVRVNQDYKTPYDLDSQYFQNVVDNKVLFDSDAALTNASDTNALVETYRTNSVKFGKDFGEAMVKMGKINKGKGVEIRKQCWTYNAPVPTPTPAPPPTPAPAPSPSKY